MATRQDGGPFPPYLERGLGRQLVAKVEYPPLANCTNKLRHSVSAAIMPRAAITRLRVIRPWAAMGKPVSATANASTPDAAQCVHT